VYDNVFQKSVLKNHTATEVTFNYNRHPRVPITRHELRKQDRIVANIEFKQKASDGVTQQRHVLYVT